jgi:hypothetical protein
VNREFRATPGRVRAALAIVALLAASACLGTIEVLAQHYDIDAQAPVVTQLSVVAKR